MWIILAASIVAVIRTTGYGIYTLRDKNICGAVGLFIIALICMAVITAVGIFILTKM
jgi:hypothetical protein